MPPSWSAWAGWSAVRCGKASWPAPWGSAGRRSSDGRRGVRPLASTYCQGQRAGPRADRGVAAPTQSAVKEERRVEIEPPCCPHPWRVSHSYHPRRRASTAPAAAHPRPGQSAEVAAQTGGRFGRRRAPERPPLRQFRMLQRLRVETHGLVLVGSVLDDDHAAHEIDRDDRDRPHRLAVVGRSGSC